MVEATSGLMPSVIGIPDFLLFMAVSGALTALFMLLYTVVTAHNEMELIRAGNNAAAVALGGTMIGFVIPLSKAISQAHNIPDLLIWGVVALAVQIVAYFAMRLMVRDISTKVEAGSMAHGVFLAAGSIASGMLNAASMTL